MKKDPLGKGLSAILKDIEEKATIRLVPLAEISPNPKQPRFEMREEALMELASSIKEKGVLPLLS
jgi:ParB family chromosome partitioning protein